VLWLVIFIVFWIGFAQYVHHVASTSSVFASEFLPEKQVVYPLFHFRLEGWHNATPAIIYNSISCVWNHTYQLAVQGCWGFPSPANNLAACFTVVTNNKTFAAYGKPHGSPKDLFSQTHFSSFIWCNFTVNSTILGTTPNWVAWEIEHDNHTQFAYGDNAYAPIYFGPFTVNQVLLEKFTISGTTYWERNHVYLPPPQNWNYSSTEALAQYITSTALITTTVTAYQTFGLSYHSWNGLADIGGLGFSLWIIQTCSMILVGLFMENDSHFLGAHSSHHKELESHSPGETSRLVH
jgi:hypothetical protein